MRLDVKDVTRAGAADDGTRAQVTIVVDSNHGLQELDLSVPAALMPKFLHIALNASGLQAATSEKLAGGVANSLTMTSPHTPAIKSYDLAVAARGDTPQLLLHLRLDGGASFPLVMGREQAIQLAHHILSHLIAPKAPSQPMQ